MSELPSEWTTIRLGDVSEHITKGATPTTYGYGWVDDGILFLRSECVTERGFSALGSEHISPEAHKSMARSAIMAGDLLMTITGYIGRTCRYPRDMPEANINQHIARIRISDEEKLDSSYALWALKDPKQLKSLELEVTGLAYPQIGLLQVQNISVPAPPVVEQRRIAEILDTLDDAIQKTEQLIAKLKQIKQGLLHDLLTRGIEENGQLRDHIAHPEQFKDSALGMIPGEWNVFPLEAMAADIPHAIVDGPFGSNLKSEHYREKGVPVIQSGFVTSGEFHAESYVYVDQSLVNAQKRSIVRPGDIVMAKIGAQCGACALMPDWHQEGILAGNSLKISLNESLCRTRYALITLHYFRQTGSLDLIKTETAQPAISLRNLKSLQLRVPRADEQDRIISVLDAHDERQLDEARYLNKLAKLKKGLMHDLLTGTVRVGAMEDISR